MFKFKLLFLLESVKPLSSSSRYNVCCVLEFLFILSLDELLKSLESKLNVLGSLTVLVSKPVAITVTLTALPKSGSIPIPSIILTSLPAAC